MAPSCCPSRCTSPSAGRVGAPHVQRRGDHLLRATHRRERTPPDRRLQPDADVHPVHHDPVGDRSGAGHVAPPALPTAARIGPLRRAVVTGLATLALCSPAYAQDFEPAPAVDPGTAEPTDGG